jgi:predicted glycoside hydrolase/deacetylase ChbG (UPF0249 family)
MPTPNPIRLVVNADAFGFHPEVSRGIVKAHREGIVTSTSVLGTVGDPEGVRDELRAVPSLGVGLSVVLVNGRPTAPRNEVASLLDESGAFWATPAHFVARWARGHIVPGHLEREIEHQLTRLRDTGLAIDHLDTHLHLGFLPVVAEALRAVARRHGIGTIRSRIEGPNLTWFVDPERGLPLLMLRGAAWLARQRMGQHGHGAQSWGFAESGNLNPMRILEILGRLGPGIHELICHPGLQADVAMVTSGRLRTFERPTELEALCSDTVRAAITERGIELCRFSDLF